DYYCQSTDSSSYRLF
nr:immunoglobulin light chain junction region [Macaca mulatta]